MEGYIQPGPIQFTGVRASRQNVILNSQQMVKKSRPLCRAVGLIAHQYLRGAQRCHIPHIPHGKPLSCQVTLLYIGPGSASGHTLSAQVQTMHMNVHVRCVNCNNCHSLISFIVVMVCEFCA